mmetsp:Transcript_20185/g.45910  ORF Transcript_20185/g.45910 Transcript_20185/m.45910 type:complete len:213 (-) Transcript_20185:210-848(-)
MSSEESILCAICYDPLNDDDRAELPCCGNSTSTVQYCKRCIQVIISRGFNGTVGRCPTCSSFITIRDGKFVAGENIGMCQMCLQERSIVDTRSFLCEKCVLGRMFSFTYECERCHGQQRIPHPMWLYQPHPNEFGNVTWACHRSCDDYTHWRIVQQDAGRVPPEHCPESWGRREEWLESIRQTRREMVGAAGGGGGAEGDQEEVEERRCMLM